MRTSLRCPKCEHNHILFLTQVADRVGEYGDVLEKDASPGEPVTRSSKAWHIARVETPEDQKSWWTIGVATVGVVQAYVCRKCGYTELYTLDPENIPVDGKIVQELIGPDTGPYR